MESDINHCKSSPHSDESREEAALSSVPPRDWLVGTLVAFDEQGAPEVRVALDGHWHSLATTPAVSVTRADLGRQAVVMLPGGALSAPLLMGFVHSPLSVALEQNTVGVETLNQKDTLSDVFQQPLSVEVDGKGSRERILEGQEKLVLRCGAASITLTEAGKIILRGRHLVSRSEGVNRILGASIQMN